MAKIIDLRMKNLAMLHCKDDYENNKYQVTLSLATPFAPLRTYLEVVNRASFFLSACEIYWISSSLEESRFLRN